MKCLLFTATAVAALSVSQIAAAQAPAPLSNNPLSSGIYIEGMVGVNVLGDLDFDIDGLDDDATIKSKLGAFGAISVGYNIPQGPLNIRIEAEGSIRGNKLDEFEFADGIVADGVDDSVTNAYAGLVNAHLDYYLLPNFAVSVGAGLGYASVEADTIVDGGAVNIVLFDEESDTALAYQGRIGARYSFNRNGTVSLAYNYFATGDVEFEDGVGNNATTSYESHSFHAGFAYHF